MQAKEGLRRFRGLKPGKRQARRPLQERAQCRQGSVLGVLGVLGV